ncbi:Os01g0128700, partial [Oryza sativa Japonica Group]
GGVEKTAAFPLQSCYEFHELLPRCLLSDPIRRNRIRRNHQPSPPATVLPRLLQEGKLAEVKLCKFGMIL